MDKLIQMTDFVLQRNEINGEDYYGYEKTAVECINYAKFLKQSLTLGMFVPVDRDGKLYDLKEVEAWKNHDDYSRFYKEELAFFEDAKEKVLFEGFNLSPKGVSIQAFNNKGLLKTQIPIQSLKEYKTIENLMEFHQDLVLTPSALKAIGIE
jgi:hypothetical protein